MCTNGPLHLSVRASGSKAALLPTLCQETAALQTEIVSPLKCLSHSFQFIYYIVFTI